MKVFQNTFSLTMALACSFLPSTLLAQQSCKDIQPGATVDATVGCIPLTFKPVDGGPERIVWVPVTFVGPIPRPSSHASAAGIKTRELDFGVNAFYVRPDYAQSVNVDVGAFVAFTGKYFGAEIDAADTVLVGTRIHEPYIVGGPRFQYRARKFTVYGKAQAGAGHFSGAPDGSFNNRKTLVVENFGAGIEIKLSHHLLVRLVDANYQVWPTFSPNNLTPLRIGSGIAFSL